jgi:Fe-S cluster assembly protein SufB
MFKLDKSIVERISKKKDEPDWMLDIRLHALRVFNQKAMPQWGPDLSKINFNDVIYYADSRSKLTHTWNDVPEDIKNLFEELNVPEQERKYLAGLSTQYDSEVIYHQMKAKYETLGIIFESMDSAVKKYPDLVKRYFGKLVKPDDNKFASLNTAVWSGGTFIYVPEGVQLPIPVQTYFRINTPSVGQFERTLIIADKNSSLQYIEGCTAPQYSTTNLHASVVEIYVFENSTISYGTMQKWSKNVYNLVTKRAIVSKNAHMVWRDFNLGSGINMKYPSTILKGKNSTGELYSLAFAESGQIMDTGGKMIHIGKSSKSIIDSKTITKGSGEGVYRGTCKITSTANDADAKITCDSLLLSEKSIAKAIPTDINNNNTAILEHEASVSKIEKDQLEYLQSRGFSTDSATKLITFGFINPILAGMLPEYALELEALLNLFLNNLDE